MYWKLRVDVRKERIYNINPKCIVYACQRLFLPEAEDWFCFDYA